MYGPWVVSGHSLWPNKSFMSVSLGQLWLEPRQTFLGDVRVLYQSTLGDLWETYGHMLKGNLLRVSLRPLYLYRALAIVEDLTHSISSHLLMYMTTMTILFLWQLQCTCGCLLQATMLTLYLHPISQKIVTESCQVLVDHQDHLLCLLIWAYNNIHCSH